MSIVFPRCKVSYFFWDIQKLNDVVTNFEQQYEQMSEEDIATTRAQYAKAIEEVAKYRYSQADNELIGTIKARYDNAKLKYDMINAKRKVNGLFDQVVGYGKEIIDILENDSL